MAAGAVLAPSFETPPAAAPQDEGSGLRCVPRGTDKAVDDPHEARRGCAFLPEMVYDSLVTRLFPTPLSCYMDSDR
jgi:hypothetical protein